MTRSESNTAAQNADFSTWWTPRRTKLAALGGLVGGVGGLLSSFGGLGLAGVSLGDTGIGITPDTIIILYPVLHILMAVGVLAANGWYGTKYGPRGRIFAMLLALSLVGEAGTILVLMVGRAALGELLLPIGILHATTYMAIRLFGSLYGISLWRHTNASRLTAGLFIVLFPAIFILPPLVLIGFPPTLIGAPLDLAFIALGYDLWRTSTDTSVRGTESLQ
jgi:hypothetical protein